MQLLSAAVPAPMANSLAYQCEQQHDCSSNTIKLGTPWMTGKGVLFSTAVQHTSHYHVAAQTMRAEHAVTLTWPQVDMHVNDVSNRLVMPPTGAANQSGWICLFG